MGDRGGSGSSGGNGKRGPQRSAASTPESFAASENTDAGRALAEAARQRDALSTGVSIAERIAPQPIGAAMALGNAMGAASERVLARNPDAVRTIPGDPGGVYGNVGGMDYSNRADYPGSNKTGRGNATRRGDRLGTAATMTLYG
jgi:hypothetical protein